MDSLEELRGAIMEKIRNGQVDDYATKNLKSLRSSMEKLEVKIREKAEALLRANQSYAAGFLRPGGALRAQPNVM